MDMNAKEMFEAIDHVYDVSIETTHCAGYGDYELTKVELSRSGHTDVIIFDGFDNSYTTTMQKINDEMHLAITQQMRELGWIK